MAFFGIDPVEVFGLVHNLFNQPLDTAGSFTAPNGHVRQQYIQRSGFPARANRRRAASLRVLSASLTDVLLWIAQ